MTKNNLSKIASILGKKGGQKSVESRFGGKSEEEISEEMRLVRLSKRYTPEEIKEMDEIADELVNNLNKNTKK